MLDVIRKQAVKHLRASLPGVSDKAFVAYQSLHAHSVCSVTVPNLTLNMATRNVTYMDTAEFLFKRVSLGTVTEHVECAHSD